LRFIAVPQDDPTQGASPLNAPTLAARKPRFTVHDLAIRRDRIFARVLEGQSCQAIAVAEAITPRWVRKIVHDALQKDNMNAKSDFVLVQIARLEGILRAIEQKMAEGERSATALRIRALEKLDFYHAQSDTLSALARRRDSRESGGMRAGIDCIAAIREAPAGRLAAAGLAPEISMRMDGGDQASDIARFADARAVPGGRESRT
jgi:DNA-binding CsgD family transcriptional regulator